jgi:hypothetical protein
VQFQARFHDGPSFDALPGPEDESVPPEEASVIQQVTDSLRLKEQNAETILRTLRLHFAGKFDYTTRLGTMHKATSNRTALAAFLLEARAGHCEYFATATTLLLRAAGIPARYAVGYAVQEKKGRHHIVRSRHAHAWALAWVDGRWQDIDTTPGNWLDAEADKAPFWEPFTDIFSRVWFEFSKWRWGPSDWKRHLVWLVVPLVGFVAFRVLRQKQWQRVRDSEADPSSARQWPGRDSELYQVEARLRRLGLERHQGETMASWLQRAADAEPDPAARTLFSQMLAFHYRLRFDPAGLTAGDRADLQTLVKRWIKSRE